MFALAKICNINKGSWRISTITRCYGTQGDFIKSKHPDVEIPKANLVEYVTRDFGRWHDKIAIECSVTGKKHTYTELRTHSINLGKSLRKIFRLEKGSVVALFLPNNPDYPVCMFGTFLAGLTLTTINPTYTPDELERHLRDAGAKIVITINNLWNVVQKATGKLQIPIHTVIIKVKNDESLPAKAINFSELLDTKTDLPDINPIEGDEVIFLPYSSGTTGLPKGVMLTNDNLVANIAQTRAPEIHYGLETTDTHQDVHPLILPMFHIYGLTFSILSYFTTGCKIITLPKFTPEIYLETIANCKPTLLHLVPPLVIFLSTYPGVKPEYFERLRTVLCGAAPLGSLDEAKFRKTVNKPIQMIQAYGMTETSPLALIIPQACEGKYPGSFGHPVPNTIVKVINPNDSKLEHLGPNQPGEILIKGPQVMKGYHNRPQDTEDAFVNGWYRTGDIVRYDEDEMFYITDRIKELIKVKGFQVAPAELEEIIRDFPGVADAAVIGIAHEYLGESPRAYIVEKHGQKVDVQKLIEYVHGKVSRHKKLVGGVGIIDSIPKNPSGKILRKKLHSLYKEKGI